MSTERELSTGGVQVVRRVAQILDVLRDEPQGLSLSQLADRTGIARSTVHRLVAALAEERLLIAASPTGRVRLGPAIARLAAVAERTFVLDFRPYLEELAEQLDETVDLAILEGDHVRFLDQVPASQRLRAVSAVGATFPAYCTANGKALLARLSDEEVTELLPRHLTRLTDTTIASRDALLQELAAIRAARVAFDREEHTDGICAVGIVVDAATAHLAISVPVPAQRFYGREEEIAAALRSVGDRVDAAFAENGRG